MPFPDSQRVIYKKNPLVEVICQLRFPTILRIDAQAPVEFQESVRREYPILKEKPLTSIQLTQEMIQMLPPALMKILLGNMESKKAYDFVSEDEQWTVSLASSFLALTAHEYRQWEQFREHFQKPFEALIEHYSPAFFSRVGLRYRNVIRKSNLGLENVKWSELLKPHIAGELASSDVPEENITTVANIVVIDLMDNLGSVRIQHGFVKDDGDEIGYLIDSDFFTEQRTEIGYAFTLLDEFNKRSRRLFRWCITDRLHKAMEPQPLAG